MQASYKFALLDDGSSAEAAAANDAVFAAGSVFGVNVPPELAARCTGASGLGVEMMGVGGSAIEQARYVDLPTAGSTLISVRADLDAFGAMAVLAIRADQAGSARPRDAHVQRRVDMIAEEVVSAAGWLPVLDLDTVSVVQALGVAVGDARRPISELVAIVYWWLESGLAPADFEDMSVRARRERADELRYDVRLLRYAAQGRITVLESTSRFAVAAAHRKASVVIAVNPGVSWQGGREQRKVLVCQRAPGYVDLGSVGSAFTPHWEGSETVISSPDDLPDTLELDDIVGIVERRLTS